MENKSFEFTNQPTTHNPQPATDNQQPTFSEEVTEILSATPVWLLRWGTAVIFGLILGALVLSYFIRYPDMLTADITLTTLNPPVTLVSKTNGKLAQLLVKNNEKVTKNQTIAVIENTANFQDILYLDSVAKNWNEQLKISDTVPFSGIKNNLQTGEITPAYLSLLKSLKDLSVYTETNANQRQIRLLQRDLAVHHSLLEKYKKQENINSDQLDLIKKDYERSQFLLDEKIISEQEYENKKREYLNALSGNEQTKIGVNNAFIQINSIEKNILQLQTQDYQEREKLHIGLQQNLQSLLSEIDKWKQQFLIESPVAGRVSFFAVWSENQNVKTGDELFSVVPAQKQKYIGKCLLPVANTGKLAVGQRVNIKLDNYPYTENGMLSGTVAGISEVPNKATYAVDVALPNGLQTSYHQTLSYKEEMKGKADIITKNVSVLDRIFFNFRKLAEQG